MKRMVIGTDGSEAAAAAVRWGASLAAATRSEVVLAASAQPVTQNLPARDWPGEVTALKDRLADEWSRPLHEAGVEFRVEVLDISPALGLQICAEDNEADLLVVGTRGRGGFSGLLLGSVADHLAHHTERPLAVVPTAAPEFGPRPILLGLDGSPGATAAAEWSASIAAEMGVPVSARHVVVPVVDWLEDVSEERWIDESRRQLEGRWTAPLRAHEVAIDCKVLVDIHPSATLIGAAHEAEAGFIVVGTRARRQPFGVRLGGVTMQLVHEASDVPVVIIPPEDPFPSG